MVKNLISVAPGLEHAFFGIEVKGPGGQQSHLSSRKSSLFLSPISKIVIITLPKEATLAKRPTL